MRRGRFAWWKRAALMPLLALYAFEGGSCTADLLRDLADEADDMAGEIDGQDDLDLDELEDLLNDWF